MPITSRSSVPITFITLFGGLLSPGVATAMPEGSEYAWTPPSKARILNWYWTPSERPVIVYSLEFLGTLISSSQSVPFQYSMAIFEMSSPLMVWSSHLSLMALPSGTEVAVRPVGWYRTYMMMVNASTSTLQLPMVETLMWTVSIPPASTSCLWFSI